MKRVMTILSTVFFLATFCVIALGQVVPDAVLYLDARDNPAHPDAWANLGTAGGELQGTNDAPELLEEAAIEIPDIAFTLEDAKYYTATGTNQTFGGPPETNPDLVLGNWTMEFLAKRNGNFFERENGFAGFRPGSDWGKGIFLAVYDNAEGLCLDYWPDWRCAPAGVEMLEGVWTWITFTGDEDAVIAYKDGEEVARDVSRTFDNTEAINGICIFGKALDERARTFNGSLAIVRVYDKALSAAEVMGNIEGAAAVDPASKLTTTWGREKTRY